MGTLYARLNLVLTSKTTKNLYQGIALNPLNYNDPFGEKLNHPLKDYKLFFKKALKNRMLWEVNSLFDQYKLQFSILRDDTNLEGSIRQKFEVDLMGINNRLNDIRKEYNTNMRRINDMKTEPEIENEYKCLRSGDPIYSLDGLNPESLESYDVDYSALYRKIYIDALKILAVSGGGLFFLTESEIYSGIGFGANIVRSIMEGKLDPIVPNITEKGLKYFFLKKLPNMPKSMINMGSSFIGFWHEVFELLNEAKEKVHE